MELTMKQKIFMGIELECDEDFDYDGKWELVKGKDKDFPFAWLIDGAHYDDVTEAFADRVLRIKEDY